MGQQVSSMVTFKGQTSEGKASLEADKLSFRGDFKLNILLKNIKSVTAVEGRLKVIFPEGTATFELDSFAEKWCHKIKSPKSLIDKLGVKPDYRVAVLNVEDENFLTQLKGRAAEVTEGSPPKETDLIFLRAENAKDLGKLKSVEPRIKRNGAVWVIIPKGKPQIQVSNVIAAAKAVGLVDVKLVSFSETHSAYKLVVPLASR